MRALGRAETDETRLASKGCHRRPWQARPGHDKSVNHSGSYRPLPAVTSYHEHQRVMRERGRGPEKYESDRDELATVDRDGGGAPMKSERGEVGNAAYPKRGCPTGWSTRSVRCWRSCGCDLVDGGAMVSAHGRGGACGGACSSEKAAREEER
jgi:hypothetical protein